MNKGPQPVDDGPVPPADGSGHGRVDGTDWLAAALAAIPSLAVVGLLLATIWLSFGEFPTDGAGTVLTLDHWRALFASPEVATMARNTLSFSLQSLAWALILGVTLAWIVQRTDVGGRRLTYALVTVGVLLPGFFTAMAYMYLLHPRIGTINTLLAALTGSRDTVINVVSIPGMAAIQGLSMSPIVFVLMAGSIANMDGALESAARVHGASAWRAVRLITLPMMKAALAGAAFYVAAISVATLDVPLIIGLQDKILVFSTYLYVQTQSLEGTEQYSIAAAFATLLIAGALVLSWAYARIIAQARRYEVISGKAQPPRQIALGRMRPLARLFVAAYLVAVVILPIVVLIWVSLLPYLQPVSQFALDNAGLGNYRALPWDLIARGIRNTGLLVLTAPAAAVLFSLVFTWLVLRSKLRWRAAFDYIAFLPHAVPTVIFAFVTLLVVVRYRPLGLDLYGSVAVLFILYVIVMLSFGTRITNAAWVQVNRELEEAAYVSGATVRGMTLRVLLPIMAPSLLMAWLWLVMFVFRELTVATLLLSRTNITLPVVIWTNWATGQQTMAAAITVVMIAVMTPLVAIYLLRFGNMIQAEKPLTH
ncbi:ABC transporter permease [Celeribacter indicus]|nr:ABC transporter permease subunit [Celeribacter indicus]